MFRARSLNRETKPLPTVQVLKGLYCREIPGEDKLIEVAARGFCTQCCKSGFYNFMRVQKPEGWKKSKELRIGNILYMQEELKPVLTISGEQGDYHCPPCHLAYLDPLNFGRKE